MLCLRIQMLGRRRVERYRVVAFVGGRQTEIQHERWEKKVEQENIAC